MIQLVDHTGQRKYLTEAERSAFLEAAKAADPSTRTFALTLVAGASGNCTVPGQFLA